MLLLQFDSIAPSWRAYLGDIAYAEKEKDDTKRSSTDRYKVLQQQNIRKSL